MIFRAARASKKLLHVFRGVEGLTVLEYAEVQVRACALPRVARESDGGALRDRGSFLDGNLAQMRVKRLISARVFQDDVVSEYGVVAGVGDGSFVGRFYLAPL